MKVRRKSDGKTIEVSRRKSLYSDNTFEEFFIDNIGNVYYNAELDFDVEESELTDSDLRISVAKLREILNELASVRGIVNESIGEIINRVKKEI